MSSSAPPGGVARSARYNQFRDALWNLLNRCEELRDIRDRHGLDHVMAIMRREAEGIWRRLAHDPAALAPASRSQGIQQPYPWTHLTETDRYNAQRNLFAHAHDVTGPIYGRAEFMLNGSPENWIIRWNVYHAFRNRDHPRRGLQQVDPSSGENSRRSGPPARG
ncbi:MAG: hypothetical protein M1831_006604 [Alyxoria varia]|nr:MAG: hypothetical protein M1831_006604 [Alyxoria varia]